MKFFKPEDFHPLSRLHGGPYQNMGEYEAMAYVANEKLEREGRVVQGVPKKDDKNHDEFYGMPMIGATHKGILINIEPLEKCKHENVRGTKFGNQIVTELSTVMDFYECVDCGAKVKPKTFEEA